jgi:hypothetical protein
VVFKNWCFVVQFSFLSFFSKTEDESICGQSDFYSQLLLDGPIVFKGW